MVFPTLTIKAPVKDTITASYQFHGTLFLVKVSAGYTGLQTPIVKRQPPNSAKHSKQNATASAKNAMRKNMTSLRQRN
jgi:hypothetical protein